MKIGGIVSGEGGAEVRVGSGGETIVKGATVEVKGDDVTRFEGKVTATVSKADGGHHLPLLLTSTEPGSVTLPELKPGDVVTVPVSISSTLDRSTYTLTASLAGSWLRPGWDPVSLNRLSRASIMACRGFTAVRAFASGSGGCVGATFTVQVHSPTALCVTGYKVEGGGGEEVKIDAPELGDDDGEWLEGGDTQTFSFFYDRGECPPGPYQGGCWR